MNIKVVMQATTKEQVRQYAIDWQNWVSEQNLSYNELNNWHIVFDALGAWFDLKGEFIENGVL